MYIYDIGVHEDVHEEDYDIIDAALGLGALPSQDHEKFQCLDFSKLRTSMTYIVSTGKVITSEMMPQDLPAVLLKHPSCIDKGK